MAIVIGVVGTKDSGFVLRICNEKRELAKVGDSRTGKMLMLRGKKKGASRKLYTQEFAVGRKTLY